MNKIPPIREALSPKSMNKKHFAEQGVSVNLFLSYDLAVWLKIDDQPVECFIKHCIDQNCKQIDISRLEKREEVSKNMSEKRKILIRAKILTFA